jgi:hypothetical protein
MSGAILVGVSTGLPVGVWKLAVWAVLFLVGAFFQARGVISRRRAGQSWNEALANGQKLMTGNVWLDGLVLAAIFALAIAIACYIFGLK